MAEFLQRIAEREDVEAFRKLFQAYAPRVKAYMMRQGADANTAEELAQETLLTVWRKAALYSGEKGSATTWIFTIARNLRIDRLRREMSWVELPDGHNEEPSPDALPDEILSEHERKGRVQRALASLPADQYEVVALSRACPTAKSPSASDCRSALSNLACGSHTARCASWSRT